MSTVTAPHFFVPRLLSVHVSQFARLLSSQVLPARQLDPLESAGSISSKFLRNIPVELNTWLVRSKEGKSLSRYCRIFFRIES